MSDLSITSAAIVLAEHVGRGSLDVPEGAIAAIDSGATATAAALDFEGDYLLPGFVKIHTDNLEKHLQPRPGVMWPSSAAAVIAHDVQVAGAGITTVFDAVSADDHDDRRNHHRPKCASRAAGRAPPPSAL
jgi:alpha-D-ribose 1-methylphosphonate 5-triphosphate diphosphatase